MSRSEVHRKRVFQQRAARANTRNEWHGNMARYAAVGGFEATVGCRMSDVGVGFGGMEGSRLAEVEGRVG